MDIGKAIRQLATTKGMTQADICRATGLSDGYMSSLWNGKVADPQVIKIRKIAHSLGITIDELLQIADEI